MAYTTMKTKRNFIVQIALPFVFQKVNAAQGWYLDLDQCPLVHWFTVWADILCGRPISSPIMQLYVNSI